jgi:2-polyprenyl-3-methyl-5-hydroxy-6-metoxy-1,4-benzoquinol methylase
MTNPTTRSPQLTPYDRQTAAYFNTHLHQYSSGRLRPVIDAIQRYATESASLIDIGCGTGAALAHICSHTGLRDVWAMDVSEEALALASERMQCQTLVGSVLDDQLSERMPRQFDFVLVAAVLHHLIAPTRRGSEGLAMRALSNAIHLLRPGGCMLVMEPVFTPAWAMDAVFYVKRAVTAVTSHRVGILGYWNNIGAPVVSYYNVDQLQAMLNRVPCAEILETDLQYASVSPLMRIAGIRQRADATFVVRKAALPQSTSPLHSAANQ